ncbi:adhesion G protein-coupled receptor F5 [Chanos chanos]|uniref:Adhesion G protein-coupled receptor F5 n=1 Tax=Chanos chanos TaxID=29144 RepID=A0A6J2WV22_CHACN|nr:adhesion G protein-coupled receptor F5-like [Chanos chanos]
MEHVQNHNSTKVLYADLVIEKSALHRFMQFIEEMGAVTDHNFTTVSHFAVTTDCSPDGGKNNCSCLENYSWTEDVSESNQCWNKNCVFDTSEVTAVCLPVNRVSIKGELKMEDQIYSDKLLDKTSSEYKALINELTEQLKRVFSTLRWFDILSISSFRRGSIIADFDIQLNEQVSTGDLTSKTDEVTRRLNATVNLVTIGIVKMTVPQGPVKLKSPLNISCEIAENIGEPEWYLSRDAANTATSSSSSSSSTEITYGSEARFSENKRLLELTASEIWKGTFTCDFKSGSVIHRGSAYLDIALLPEITTIVKPQFPDCRDLTKKIPVDMECRIRNSSENYAVFWEETKDNLIFYKADTVISCKRKEDRATAACIFKNRLNDSATMHVYIPIIYNIGVTCGIKSGMVCEKENQWPLAKASNTAILECEAGRYGVQKRECSSNGTWLDETSNCVNAEVLDVLQRTQEIEKGLGDIQKKSPEIFKKMKDTTDKSSFKSFANLNASVESLSTMLKASFNFRVASLNGTPLPDSVLPDFVQASSNLLNGSMRSSWDTGYNSNSKNDSLGVKYLSAVDGLIQHAISNGTTNNTLEQGSENLELKSCRGHLCQVFNTSITLNQPNSEMAVKVAGFKHLVDYLPRPKTETESKTIVLSLHIPNYNGNVIIDFNLTSKRLRNHEMNCVYWDEEEEEWSDKGCRWDGAENARRCICEHLSSFTILMSKSPVKLPYMEELTYVGVGASVISLALCIIIEFLVWNTVVKSNVAHFRHTALVNISFCLLTADCCFLASAFPNSAPKNWCLTLTVLKHFFFLAMFFWMLCLSIVLLHQMIFIFAQLRKKIYLGFSFVLGYVCPLVIVALTLISYNNGEDEYYYSKSSCWLKYDGPLKGSIHAFVFPVGIIVLINMFSMFVVIAKLLKPSVSDGSITDEKNTAKSILKAVVLLTPIFGTTWLLGLFVMIIDLTTKPTAYIVNYAFTFFNAFQGFFILLTSCFGEKRVRDALLMRFGSKHSKTIRSETATKTVSSVQKK